LVDRSRKIERSTHAIREQLEEDQKCASEVLNNLKPSEQKLEALENAELEHELAEAYIANSPRNLELLKEFEHVDREGWEAIP
jgi:DNA-binding FrmR family transcriptional regulator